MATEIRIGNITELAKGVRVNLLRCDGVPAPETFLESSELEKLSTFKVEKRRRDWLGGRYVAKTLLRAAFAQQTPLTQIEIAYDTFGRPVWRTGARSILISITHSGPFCAAACGGEDAKFLGIDLEKAEPRAAAWYKDYFHKEELAGARGKSPASSPESHATLLWTRKEALLKALGLGLKADLLDIDLAGEEPRFSRAALERHRELGSPAFSLLTFTPVPGWRLSIVCESASNLLK